MSQLSVAPRLVKVLACLFIISVLYVLPTHLSLPIKSGSSYVTQSNPGTDVRAFLAKLLNEGNVTLTVNDTVSVQLSILANKPEMKDQGEDSEDLTGLVDPAKTTKTEVDQSDHVTVEEPVNEPSVVSEDVVTAVMNSSEHPLIYDSFEFYNASVDPNVRLLDGRPTTLLIGFFTTANSTEGARRADIRRTFAHMLPSEVRLVFVMYNSCVGVQSYDHVYAEQGQYHDIFFLDGEENMDNGKTFTYFDSVYHKLQEDGDSIQYVMKSDTDSFINIYALLPWILETVTNPAVQPAIFGCQYQWAREEWIQYEAPEGLDSAPYMNGGGYGISYASLKYIATSPSVAENTIGYEDKTTGLWMHSLGEACIWHNLENYNGFVDKAWVPEFYDYGRPLTLDTKIVHAVKSHDLFNGIARTMSDFLEGKKTEDCTYMNMTFVEGESEPRCEPMSENTT